MGDTKWSILSERRDALLAQAGKLQDELDGMEATPFGQPCACGQMLATEGDFARHFTVPNRAYLNLGDCPNRLNPGEYPARYAPLTVV